MLDWLRTIASQLHNLTKPLAWTILTSTAGLLQVFLLAAYSYFWGAEMDSKALWLGCVFLFFATSLVSSVMVDYYFDRRYRLAKWAAGVAFSLFPLILIGLATILFVSVYVSEPGKITPVRFERTVQGQMVMVSGSLIYSIIIKYFQFRRGG